MKKKLSIILISLFIVLSLFIAYKTIPITSETNKKDKDIKEVKKTDYNKIITDLKKKYNNDDIVALVEIPNVLEEIIVQTYDNDYYLHYDINRNENIIGATFLDYRINLNDSKKILIYSHSDPEGTLPFVKLNNYNNEDFYKDNKYIYLIDSTSKRKYEVFASYIEASDFDYVNLETFNGLTYGEHLNKLKNKSVIKTDVELDDNSKVLILQTCSFNDSINAIDKYQLVMAKEIKKTT